MLSHDDKFNVTLDSVSNEPNSLPSLLTLVFYRTRFLKNKNLAFWNFVPREALCFKLPLSRVTPTSALRVCVPAALGTMRSKSTVVKTRKHFLPLRTISRTSQTRD